MIYLKTCRRCSSTKPVSRFSPAPRDTTHSWCKECKSRAEKERRETNPEAHRAAVRRYRHGNREKVNAQRNVWYRENKELIRERRTIQSLERRYGMSHEDFQRMLLDQGGACAICRKKVDRPRRLSVDHNHETGEVRGLLCSNCNTAIGLFRESSDALIRAAWYLEEHSQTLSGASGGPSAQGG